MEHPLIHNTNDLTDDELADKISELTKKYGIAQRSGNGHLCQQIAMALETYRNKLQERYRKPDNTGFEGKIDIS